jgi:hypothetical protein
LAQWVKNKYLFFGLIMKALRFKHIYGETQREKYEQVTPSTITCDSTMIKGNAKSTAFLWGQGGIVAIVDNDKPCKIPMDKPMIKGHQGTHMYQNGRIHLGLGLVPIR